MSLFFGASTSDKVDCGSAAILDNLPAGANGFTVLTISKRSADGINKSLVSRDGTTTQGWIFTCDGAVNGDLRFIVWRPTRTDYQTNIACLPLNEWAFAAVTYNEVDTAECAIYYGPLNAPAVEATYVLAQNGSGVAGDDSTFLTWIGNLQRAPTNPFTGDIGIVAIINRRITLAECEDWKNNPRVIAGTILFQRLGENGDGLQLDLSGNGNNGTVTGATVRADPPLIRTDKRRLPLVPYALVSGASGTIAATLGTFTPSIIGTTTVTGSMAQAMAAFTSSITGTSTIIGTIAANMADFTSGMSGNTGIAGTMAAVMNAFTSAITGTTTILGTIATTLGDVLSSISGFIGTQTARLLALLGVGS